MPDVMSDAPPAPRTGAPSEGWGAADPGITRDHPVRSIGRLLAVDRGRVAGAVFFFVIKSSPAWLMPFFTARIIDVVVSHAPARQLWINAVLLTVLVLQNLPTNMLYVRLQSRAIRNAELRLRAALTQRIQELSIGFYATARASTLQTKVVRDVENVEQMLRQSFDLGLQAVVTMIGGIALTAVQAPALVGPLVLLVIIAGLSVSLLRHRLTQRNAEFRQEVEQMSAKVAEMTTMVPLTRAHGLEQREVARIGKSISRVRTAGLDLDQANGFFSAAGWISYQLFSVGCLVGAAWLAWSQWLPVTPGDVVLVSSYMITLTGSVIAMTALAPIVTRGLESVKSIGEVLATDDLERNDGRTPVRSVRGQITFEHVSLRYPDAAEDAVQDQSFTVEPGSTVALVGPSGSGKSSALNLVLGFVKPTAGRVLLDGRDLQSLDLRTYRRHVSVVSQSTVLFDGTIRENVAFGRAEVGDDEVVQALKDAQAWDFVSETDRGLDTVVGPNGATLSGGQRQRIAIARALVRDPRVLLLDEATSALDPLSESRIQRALEGLMAGRTTFVVAHRLSTVRTADRILVMDHGRVVEEGTYEALMARGGRFAELQAGATLP